MNTFLQLVSGCPVARLDRHLSVTILYSVVRLLLERYGVAESLFWQHMQEFLQLPYGIKMKIIWKKTTYIFIGRRTNKS